MAITDSQCVACKWFDGSGRNDRAGLCRAELPAVVVANNKLITAWPVVAETDWCAKYVAR